MELDQSLDPWKVKLLNYAASQRVFRSGDLIAIAEEDGIPKRTVDYFIRKLTDQVRIFPAHRGVYFINHPAKPVSPAEIARIFNPLVAVSLETSFKSASFTGREDLRTHVVAPTGRMGSFESPLGSITIHTMKPEYSHGFIERYGADKVLKPEGFGFGSVPAFTPTFALAHICLLAAQARRGYTYGTDLPANFMSQLDADLVSDLQKNFAIPFNQLGRESEHTNRDTDNPGSATTDHQHDSVQDNSPSPF